MSEVNPIDKIFNHFEDRQNRQTIPSCSHLHRASPVQEIHETICFSGSLMPQNRTNKNITNTTLVIFKLCQTQCYCFLEQTTMGPGRT